MTKRIVLLLLVVLSPVLMGAEGCLSPVASEPDTGLTFCSRAGFFYCGTVSGPQLMQDQGFTGYCTLGAAGTAGTTIGYSGYMSGGGITEAYRTSTDAWNEGCGASWLGGRGVCNSVTTCYRE